MASSSGAIRAGRAFVELLLNDKAFTAGLAAASKKLKQWGTGIQTAGFSMMKVGAVMVAPMLGAAKSFADAGSKLNDMSARTGASVEALAELGYVAKMGGASIDDVESGLRKMQKTLVSAAQGTGEAAEALSGLGLNVGQLGAMKPDEQFKAIATAIAGIDDPAVRATMTMRIFGKGAGALLPMLKLGGAGIDDLAAKARRLGLVMSTEDAEAADVLGDSLDTLWMGIQAAYNTIGAALAPALTRLADLLAEGAAAVGAWIKEHQGMVFAIVGVGSALIAGGVALWAFGGVMKLVGVAMTLGTVVTNLFTGALVILKGVLLLVMSPIGLVIAAVAALGVKILYYSGAGGAALEWLGARFGELKDFALTTFGAIGKALASGNFALAADVLWASLKLAFYKGVTGVQEVWQEFKFWLMSTAISAWYGLLEGINVLWHGIKTAWIEGVAAVKSLWAGLVAWHATKVNEMADVMVRAWIWAQEKTGAISKRDADFQRAYNTKQGQMTAADIASKEKASKVGAESERKAALAKDLADYEAAMVNLVNAEEKAKEGLGGERDKNLKKAKADLDAARVAWEKSIAAANASEKMPTSPTLDKAGKEKNALEDLANASAKHSVIGVFNAAAADQRMAGGGNDALQKKIKDAAEASRKLLEDISNKLNDMNGLVFA